MSFSEQITAIFLIFIFAFSYDQAQEGDEPKPGESVYFAFDCYGGKDIHELVAYVREQTGANIVVAPDISVKISSASIEKLKELPWMEFLEMIVKEANCKLERRGSNIWMITQEPQISLQLENVEVKRAIEAIVSVANVNIVYGKEITGKISLRLHEVSWDEALEAVIQTAGDYQIVRESHNILRVAASQKLKKQTETRVIPIKYLRKRSPYQAKFESRVAKERK